MNIPKNLCRTAVWCIFLVSCVGVVFSQKGFSLCEVDGCNCSQVYPHIKWINVNCNLHEQQTLRLENGHIPKEAMEIAISGGHTIVFEAKSFNSFEAFDLLRIDGTKRVHMNKKSFFNLTSFSLHVQIEGCDELRVSSSAFEDMQGYPTLMINDVLFVHLEEAVFSKLQSATFKNIEIIKLQRRSFKFRNMGSIGKHGPVTVIHFENVTVPSLPSEVFASSLADITITNSRIDDVESDAFSATQISGISFIRSNFSTIRSKAISEQTQIYSFIIKYCTIDRIETEAFVAAMTNLTVDNSFINDIEPRAILGTIAKVEITSNELVNIHKCSLCFSSWNKIIMDSNIIKELHSNFVDTEKHADIEKFSFKSNEIYTAHDSSLNFVPNIKESVLIFDDNFFNISCSCHIEEWAESMMNSTRKIEMVLNKSFCRVNKLLSECLSLPMGIINMENFTETACKNITECHPYNGEIRTIDTTSKIYLESDDTEKKSWLIIIVTIIGFFILALIVTFIVLIVRASRWLKRKGYFRNVNYTSNAQSNEEEENTIVTIDENEKLEIPEELTLEFLQELSQRLDDPATHQEASEMIERLYEMFIIEDSYENNNRQEEEQHLYEELGNLNRQIPPPPYEEQPSSSSHNTSGGARGILRIMEEKFNSSATEINAKPALVSDYSEPNDAAVHLYSELKKNESGNAGSLNSNKSGNIALRPLPDKPEAGPSSRFS